MVLLKKLVDYPLDYASAVYEKASLSNKPMCLCLVHKRVNP